MRHTHALLAATDGHAPRSLSGCPRYTLVRAGGVEVDLTRRFADVTGDEELRVLLAGGVPRSNGP